MIARDSNSIFGQWWWTVDRVILFALLVLMTFGILLAVAATPMVANRMGIEKFYFLKRHLFYLIPSLCVIFSISILDDSKLKKLAVFLFIIFTGLTFVTLIAGTEIKGARRWVSLLGFSLQPSVLV
jgi:cell division protein FtsW